MYGRYSHPYQNGGEGGGQSSASFASSSKLRPPTYLAQAPTFPRQSLGSLRRSVIGDTSIDSLPRQSNSPSNISHNDTHQSSSRRRGRKSAFDTFDELGFCNDLASKIANELAARPSRNPRRSVPIDPWRGTIPGSTPQANADDTTQNGIEGQEKEDDDSDDEEDSDSVSEDGDEDEDEEEEEQEEGENELDAERTERTRLAAEAFLQRLAERGTNGDIDESEKGLEKQVFEVFGGNSEGQEIRSSTDQLEQEDVSPEVAMQVAQMLQKSTTQNEPGQKPLIEEVDEQENKSDTEQNELLADSSIEYDQLKTISSEAARNREEDVEDESDNDSLSGEAEIEGEEEEDDDEDDESEGVEEDYYDEQQQQHQYLYTQPSRSGSMGIYGSNQEDAISLIDSDEEDEMRTNSQPANYNRMAHDAAQYEKYQDGSDDEQEVDEEEVEDVEDEDDEMDDEDEGERDVQNGMEMLQEGDHNVPADDAALFQDNQQIPPFDPAFAASMPADPSNLWQNSIQQSLQVLNELNQAPPAVFDQNLSSDQPSFPSSLPQAAFSPNLFEQAFPTSSESIDNQTAPQLTPHNSTWSSFPMPPSPAPVPPPPAEAEAIGMADGEALLQLKAQVSEQVEEDQQRSHRTSLSPVPPSTVMTTQANQSMASTPKPTAGHVKDGKDLVDLKNVVKRAAALRSQRTSVASDIGTPRNDLPTPGAVQPIVEEDEALSQQFQPPNPDQDLGQEIEITEVRSTAGDQAVEHLLIQPDVESVTSLIHEHVPETQDESSRDLHIREVLVDADVNDAKDTEDAVAGIAEIEGSGIPLDAPEVQAAAKESEEPQQEDLQDPIEPVEGTFENVEAVNTLDAVLEQVKEDLDAAVKDEGLEEIMEIDQTVPEVEVNVEAPTADEKLEANGLIKEAEEAVATPTATEDMVTEEQEREEEPVIMDQKAEEMLAHQLQVPEDVSMQEADKLHADQDEIEVAADSSTKVGPRRSGRKRGSVSESTVEHGAADEDVQAPESRRETRSSTKRAASEALSTKSGHEADHNHPMQSSPHSHRKPRRSDPDGDLADYVPEDVRRKRMRSRTRSPSVARETVVPTSIGIPDKLLDTSILEEDEEEEEEQQVTSSTPAKGKRGRKPKKEIEAAEQSTQESSSNPLENELQSGKTNSPRKKTEEEKKIYKRQRKKDYDDRRKKSTRNTKGTDSSSAMGVGEEGQNVESQNSKDDPEPEVEKEVEAEAELPKESVQPEPTPPMRVTRRSTRQRTEEQEAENSQSQGADQSMNDDDDAGTEQQDEEKGESKRPLRQSGRRRGRGKK